MGTSDAVLQLTVPPQPHRSRIVRERILAFAVEHGVSDDVLADFMTALGEAVANAIEHARSEEAITVECRISADRIQAEVADSGVGFSEHPEAFTKLPEPTAERGRGLPLMRRCSDIFQVRSAPGRGTAVKVGRFLHDSSPQGSRARLSA